MNFARRASFCKQSRGGRLAELRIQKFIEFILPQHYRTLHIDFSTLPIRRKTNFSLCPQKTLQRLRTLRYLTQISCPWLFISDLETGIIRMGQVRRISWMIEFSESTCTYGSFDDFRLMNSCVVVQKLHTSTQSTTPFLSDGKMRFFVNSEY